MSAIAYRTASFALVVSLICVTMVASAGVNKDELKKLIEEFNQEPRSVRLDHPLGSLNFLEYGDSLYAYSLPSKFIWLAQEGNTFAIRKEKTKGDKIVIEVETPDGIRSAIQIIPSPKVTQQFIDDIPRLTLRDIFIFEDPLYPSYYAGNINSKILHLSSANHLAEDRVYFNSVAEAGADGYKNCDVCFWMIHAPALPDYAKIRRKALEESRMREILFPPVQNDSIQQRVQELGEQLLNRYPVDLVGYNYRFRVLESDYPEAYSLPTGFVYITSSLYNSIENEAELAFLLAHEITHVEEELTEYIVDKSNVPSSAYSAYYDDRRKGETSADILSLLMVGRQYDMVTAREGARTVLLKLQTAGMQAPNYKTKMNDSHPSFRNRSATLSAGNMIIFDKRHFVLGIDKNGEEVARVSFIGMQVEPDWVYAFIIVYVSSQAEEGISISQRKTNYSAPGRCGVLVDNDGIEYVLSAADGYRIGPGGMKIIKYAVGGRFQPNVFNEHNAPQDFKSLSLKLSGDIVEWVNPDKDEGSNGGVN